ncbi:MAG: hypothetical protein JSW02_02135 [candidate division WOR-3 bacterium]|nr:MAG: hypothetical protein JSW02_02135 [candidate division WOR-3 bacterium]
MSPNNQYCLCAEMRGGTVFYAEEFTLKNGNTVLYRVCDPGIHTFFVSDHGTVFTLGERYAVFYDRTGECDTLMEIVYMNNSGFTEHYDLFYLSMRDGMYVYTLDGALLYTLAPGRLIASTESGKHIAAVSDDTLRLYTEGVLIHTVILETAYVHGVSFTEDGTVCVAEAGGMEIFDMSGRKVE